MDKLLKTLFFSILAFSSISNAEIIETMHLGDICNYIEKDSLVIFDIDNTLVEPIQTLGSDQWFHYQIEKYLDQEFTPAEALDKALAEWNAIQNITQVQIVEEGSAEIVEKIQKDGYVVMGLTTRGLGLSDRTIHQLYSLNIDFSVAAPNQEEHYFMNKLGVLFRNGILFTSGTNKGKALEKFLKLINYKPASVVFINDKETHLADLEKGCIEMGIKFTGLRYGVVDEKVANFNKDVAEIQFANFGHILSDDVARKRESVLGAN